MKLNPYIILVIRVPNTLGAAQPTIVFGPQVILAKDERIAHLEAVKAAPDVPADEMEIHVRPF